MLDFLNRKRSRADETAEIGVDWKVVRVAAKDEAQRSEEGGSTKSRQRKVACDRLELKEKGAIGTVEPGLLSRAFLGQRERLIVDYNNYRSGGHAGRFEAGTKDRAISIATTAAYAKLQHSFTGSNGQVVYGDLGENILLKGPSATENKESGLYVGARISIGDSAVVIITEANNPCYRFNTQTWADAGQSLWGKTSPNGEVKQWFKSPECPLNNKINPGVRGWLARVVTEGTIQPGETAKLLLAIDKKGEKLPPPKRRKTNKKSSPRSLRNSPTRKVKQATSRRSPVQK